jgi:hypothetical protein
MLGCFAAALVAVSAPMIGLLANAAGAAPPSFAVTEVAPWGSSSSTAYMADWFELTNTGSTPVTITGWKMDDDSASFASAVALNGITSIAAGESVIFIETSSAAAVSTFKSTWFGNNVPSGLQVGTYSGSGVGLSQTSDAVTIFDSGGTQVTKVTFGASGGTTPLRTFDNAALASGAISTLSVTGTNGAFVAANDANEIGSPGTIGAPGPMVPEVPYAAILPAGAILVLGAGLAVRRLRRRPAAA